MEELEIQSAGNTPEPEPDPGPGPGGVSPQTVSIEEWMASGEPGMEPAPQPEWPADAPLLALLEALVYVTEDPLTVDQIAATLGQQPERVGALLEQLVAEFDRPEHGVSVREVAGGYKMATKPEHHEAVRNFVKSLKTPLKLSLPALETLAVIAYKQPVTTPEIMEIRGVQGGGVLKTLLDRKLITEAGRKNVIGKPILYKTTREFLIQFGLRDLSELPSLKEFEEIRLMAMADSEIPGEVPVPAQAELNLEAPAADTVADGPAPDAPAENAGAPAPAAEGDAPVSESAARKAGTAAPTSQSPKADSEAPAAEGDAPASESAAPDSAAASAETESAAREAGTAAPTSQSPKADSEAPAAEGDAPVSESAAPDSAAAAAETGTAAPTSQTPAADSKAQAPESYPSAESQDH
jgi:segregation and condensation protein B